MNEIKNLRLTFIGSGFMAQAMIAGLISSGTVSPSCISVVNPTDPDTCRMLEEKYGISYGDSEKIETAEAVFFAVKPQTFPEVCRMYGKYFTSDKLYLTIMAGISCSAVEQATNNAPVVRFMPNLALSVQKSATAFCLGEYASDIHAETARSLFSPLGVCEMLPESMMSAVTALSGSGPAYFYYLCEAMISAAVKDGMDGDTARKLAVQTFIGTAELISESGESPTEMRRRITSAKGTTEAGICAMTENGFFGAVESGYISAKNRADELGKR